MLIDFQRRQPMQDPLHIRLRQLVGQRFNYLGEIWVLIEVLGDDDSVVLRPCVECTKNSVQRNAYGEPNRRVSSTITLPISDKSGGAYSQDILLLLEGRLPPSSD